MKSRLFGASGLRVSEICLGTGTFGQPDRWGATHDESARILDVYLEAGGHFLDCANTYADGRSEEVLGALAKGRRDELVIGTKYTALARPGDPNAWGNHRKNLRQSLTASLRRLQTDYIDVLWVHAWDKLTPLEEIMRALDDEVSAGRVLYVGVSNTPAWAVARANTIAELRGWSRFAGLQTEYNLCTRTSELELMPMARALGLQVVAWSPLGGGLLAGGYTNPDAVTGRRHRLDEVPARRLELAARVTQIAAQAGRPPASVALAWLWRRRGDVIPIVGARSADQLRENLSALHTPLDDDCARELDALSAPPPIMPDEFMNTPAAVSFFDQGMRELVLD
jgi:aryl-alcohol dehydrogenase-like predicted oxidoreductase